MKRKLLILSALSMLSVGMAQAQSLKAKVTSLKAKVTVKMNEKDANDANYIQESVYAFNSSDVNDFFRMNFCADAYNFEDGTKSTGQIYMSKDNSHDMPLLFIDRTSCHASIEFVDDEEVHGPSVTVSAVSQGWGTICSPFVMEVPDETTGLNVYSPTYDATKSELVLGNKLAAGTIIPKQTPLLVRSSEIPASGSQTFMFNAPLSDAGATLTAPSLKWSLYGYNKGTARNIYTLGISDNKENTVVGFYRYTGTKVPCFKAYLVVDGAGAKAVSFSMGDEESTSIDGITDVLAVGKTAYNLNGQRVNSDTKGIVIVNGKKLFNK